MGKHSGSGSGKGATRPAVAAARVLAASGVLAVSLCALNLSGDAAGPTVLSAAVARHSVASGVVGPSGGYGHGAGLPGPYSVGTDGLPAAILPDPQALLSFVRPQVGSTAKSAATLNIGLTGFGRPPAGYLMAPLESLLPTSPFGFRTSPLTGEAGDFHLGQDYAAACGTSVHAADSGVVRAAGWHAWGGGNRVEIDHGNGLITTYNHLDSIAVRAGDTVQAGQVIAEVGSTGWSTGCHLHFETILDGRHTSPLKWGLISLRALPGQVASEPRSYAPGTDLPPAQQPNWVIPVGNGSNARLAVVEAGGTATTAAAPPSVPATLQPPATQQAPATPTAPAVPGTPSDGTTQPSGGTATEPGTTEPGTTEPGTSGASPSAPTPTAPTPTAPTPAAPTEPSRSDPVPTEPALPSGGPSTDAPTTSPAAPGTSPTVSTTPTAPATPTASEPPTPTDAAGPATGTPSEPAPAGPTVPATTPADAETGTFPDKCVPETGGLGGSSQPEDPTPTAAPSAGSAAPGGSGQSTEVIQSDGAAATNSPCEETAREGASGDPGSEPPLPE